MPPAMSVKYAPGHLYNDEVGIFGFVDSHKAMEPHDPYIICDLRNTFHSRERLGRTQSIWSSIGESAPTSVSWIQIPTSGAETMKFHGLF